MITLKHLPTTRTIKLGSDAISEIHQIKAQI